MLRVSLVCSRAGANVLRQWVRNPEVEYLLLPERIDQAASRIREARIDHLHYWEVGTDSTNYFLPFFRPAPVQSAGWGWPVTSGNPCIDYFVSAKPLESDQSDRHYTERLFCLPSLPTCYPRPPVPTHLKSRQQYGLRDEDHVYLCVQNLRKLQPLFDPLLAEILRSDSKGRLLLIADQQPKITAQLESRIQKSAPDVYRRLRVMPRMPEAEYLNLVSIADVVLDTPGYGGGANTVYDALACGTPSVTWPGTLHRGRWCAAAHRQLGLDECIVNSFEQYVKTAIQIGSDRALCVALRQRLLLAQTPLFENPAPVRELTEFFLQTGK
jgi:predicted O-linked N-acetylglucosamine transferase (SPINDLY family)